MYSSSDRPEVGAHEEIAAVGRVEHHHLRAVEIDTVARVVVARFELGHQHVAKEGAVAAEPPQQPRAVQEALLVARIETLGFQRIDAFGKTARIGGRHIEHAGHQAISFS